MKIGILGAGTWGTALSRLLFNNGHDVVVWSAISEEVKTLSTSRRHKNLEGMEIPLGIEFTEDIKKAVENNDITVFAVPSVFVRNTARLIKDIIKENAIVVDVAKGIEPESMKTLTEVIQDEIKKPLRLVALSGPTHAEEVALDMPTTIVSASSDKVASKIVQDAFMCSVLRVYTNSDIIGVEICGALKNVIALACGISTGLGYGDNAKAGLMTRGIKEIERIGRAVGAKEGTFYGLAGIGDLIVTATSMHSRNNRCGILIGQGYSAEDAKKEVGMVVEGIYAIEPAKEIAKKYNKEIPIISAVDDIISGRISAVDAVAKLMMRDKKSEHEEGKSV